MSALNELETLQDGLTSAFWQQFSQFVTKEWGPSGVAFQQMYQAGITAKDWEKVVAANEIQKAMLGILAWPQNRVTQLRAAAARELAVQHGRGGV